ncbi:TetR/AcrR family transcriptional regulator [Mumia sp. Pv 4-285]|uniref:TetR/AcrR family transcriptional regulator n=1 Tax=Mumia qirimensis TaxID=3234852 RepID=UPI00351D5999
MDKGTPKRRRTSLRIASCALDLFEERGFEATTVAEVAAAAGVTEMTVYRHFPSKDRLVLDDPYDPLVAASVGRQDPRLAPIRRAARGLREAWSSLPEPATGTTRRRVRLVAGSEVLRGAAWRNNQQTERLIADQLVRDGVDDLSAAAAASATLAALMAALFLWAQDGDLTLSDAIGRALDVVEGRDG